MTRRFPCFSYLFIKVGMLKGYHFHMEDIQKEYFFCQKWHLKGCISWRSLSLLATLPSSPDAFCTVNPVLLLHRASNNFAEYKTQYNACNTCREL